MNIILSYFLIIQMIWMFITLIIVLVLSELFNYKCELSFIWFDLWEGIYIDRKNKVIYIGSLPIVIWKCKKEKKEIDK